MMIFDTHAHYDDEQFDEDREELLNSMQTHGVEAVTNIGSSLAASRRTIGLTEKYPFVYGAIGVHPNEVGELEEDGIAWLKEMCALPKIVAVGEIGLDYYWDEPGHDIQKKWFERQLELAREVKLPVVIHSRDAAKDTLDIMKAEKAENLSGVIHCYAYSKEHAKEYMNMGYYLGIGGVVTFPDAKRLKEVVEYAPLDYLLLETDAPYLSPVPRRGKRNNSLQLGFVMDEIARIKGVSFNKVAEVTRENAKRLFHI